MAKIDIEGPTSLDEARATIVALFNAFDAATEALAAQAGGYSVDWVAPLAERMVREAKGTEINRVGGTDVEEAEAMRKAIVLMEALAQRLRDRIPAS